MLPSSRISCLMMTWELLPFVIFDVSGFLNRYNLKKKYIVKLVQVKNYISTLTYI